jgi:ABC-type uncharacterized transport system involved in gliding motility auxiliary subunit
MERKARAATLSGVLLVVMAVVLVLVNALAYAKNGRLDMTKNERYTLSKGSARLVNEGLKENLLVTLYVTKGLPKTDLFIEDLESLLKEYEDASKGADGKPKLTYTILEPKTEEDKNKAKEAGLQEVALGEETGDAATITQGYMGIVFEYGSEKETIPVLSPDQNTGLEFWITNKIREIRDRADDTYQKVGVIDKEGIKLTDDNLVPPQGGQGPSIKTILQQALPFYKIEDVDLGGGENPIDDSLRGVILLQADADWTDKELARIDEFLMKGDRSLLAIAGAVNMKANDPTMKATLSTRGLEKLLDGYGIEMKKDAISDLTSQMRLPMATQSGRLEYYTAPGILQLQHEDDAEEDEQVLDNAFAGFFRLDELSFPYPSTLVPHPDKQPNAKVAVVARTSENAQSEATDSVEMGLKKAIKAEGEASRRAIAIAVEGKLKSAFAGKVPEGMTIPAESAADSRVLCISASQFLANPFARAGNPPPMPPQMQMMGAMGGDRGLQQIAMIYARQYLTATILSFKNLLDWMSGDKDLIAVSAKLLGDANLKYSAVPKPDLKPEDSEEDRRRKEDEWRQGRNALQQKISWWLTLLPAVAFMGIGILRWRMREGNRENVKL